MRAATQQWNGRVSVELKIGLGERRWCPQGMVARTFPMLRAIPRERIWRETVPLILSTLEIVAIDLPVSDSTCGKMSI